MKIVYFYAKDGKKIGPLSREQLDDLHLTPDTLVWHYGLTGWIPYKNLPKQVVKEDEESPFDKFMAKFKREKGQVRKSDLTPPEATQLKTDETEVEHPQMIVPKKKRKWVKILLITLASLLSIAIVFLSVSFVIAVNEEDYPEYVNGFYNKSLMFLEKDNNSLCLELVNKAQNASEAGMRELEKYYYDAAFDVGSNDDDVLFKIGEYYADNEVRSYKMALLVYRKINNQERSDVQAAESWCLYQLGNKSLAIQKAQQAYLADSSNYRATVTLYCSYYDNKDWDNCIKWADRSLELRSDFAQTYYMKAYSQYQKGLKNSAKENFKKAVSLEPEHWMASRYKYIGGY